MAITVFEGRGSGTDFGRPHILRSQFVDFLQPGGNCEPYPVEWRLSERAILGLRS